MILGYIADFYCSELRLVIEVDGPYHVCRQDYDRKRTFHMQRKGFTVIRFFNEEILLTPERVVSEIQEVVQDLRLKRL